jgi:hypothetical protein
MPDNEITGKSPLDKFLENDVRIVESDLGACLRAVVNLCH